MNTQEKIDFANQITSDLEDAGYEYSPEGGDSPEDLTDSELETLMNQLLEKSKRPRRPVPVI